MQLFDISFQDVTSRVKLDHYRLPAAGFESCWSSVLSLVTTASLFRFFHC